MNAGGVAMVAELFRFPGQIRSVPEGALIEALAPDRPNQSFDKGLGNRDVRIHM
jgi:hypothetical protein